MHKSYDNFLHENFGEDRNTLIEQLILQIIRKFFYMKILHYGMFFKQTKQITVYCIAKLFPSEAMHQKDL